MQHYRQPVMDLLEKTDPHFVLCDFRGADVLTMELLKCVTPQVSVYHMGERPRYTPDPFRTRAGEWQFLGSYTSDKERDTAAINACTHFLAVDFNSDANRKSGTQKSIETCLKLGKIRLGIS